MEQESGPDKPKRRLPRTAVMGLRFWQQAQRDLEASRVLLTPRTYFAAVFHAEEAAEKALKAAHWHLLAEEPAWTHQMDLTAVRVAERVGDLPPEVQRALSILVTMTDRTRYPTDNPGEPIPAEAIDANDADSAIQSAEVVLTWAGSLLQQPPGRPRRRKS